MDVGCFPLDLFNKLTEQGYEMYGISSEHEQVKQKGVISLNIETDNLPFENDFFDLVLFSEVMEHMVYDPQVYLRKFLKVLKPNGYLLVTTPNAVHLKHRLMLLCGKSQYFPLFQFDGSIYHRHNREFTLSELKEVLQKAKFNVIESKLFTAYGPFRKKLHKGNILDKISKIIAYFPTIIFPSLRDSLFLLAQK